MCITVSPVLLQCDLITKSEIANAEASHALIVFLWCVPRFNNVGLIMAIDQ